MQATCAKCPAVVTFDGGDGWLDRAVVALRAHMHARHARWARRHAGEAGTGGSVTFVVN